MLTYMIVVNDNGEMKSISQEEFEAAFIAAGYQPHIEFFVNKVLDERSAFLEQQPGVPLKLQGGGGAGGIVVVKA